MILSLAPRKFLVAATLAATLGGCASNAAVAPKTIPTPTLAATASHQSCQPNPYGKRSIYLRGSFNTWGAEDAQRFTYLCNRFELVSNIKGEHTFKLGDEEWSKDADFGGQLVKQNEPIPLAAKGDGIKYSFNGNHRIIFNMADQANPTLSISNCEMAPLGDTVLYLRGSMNNWGVMEDYAFQFSCDAYYLNVKAQGKQEFKIADATWTPNKTFGGDNGGAASLSLNQTLSVGDASNTNGVGNLDFAFADKQTIRLAFPGGRAQVTVSPKSFADPRARSVDDPIALSMRHDSRSSADKSPFGAVTAGTQMNFAMTANKGVSSIALVIEKRKLEGNQDILEYREVARVPMSKSSDGDKEKWQAHYRFADASVYGYYFEALIGDKTFIYQNNTDAIYWTREKGSNGAGRVEEKPDTPRSIRRYRQTVYAADFKVPEWAKDAVYYYIFPERFRNGDARNDPKPGVNTYQDKGVEFHADWNQKPFKPKAGDGSDEVYNNDFFGGDLAGIIEKLDYIVDLGANVIYMTPIFTAASNHKYDTADYRNVDPAFGSNEEFTRLTAEAKKRGIRIMLDASLNHVGSDSIYFDRFGKYKTSGAFENAKINSTSPYADWFSFDATQTEPNKQYKGWVGVLDLPELNKASKDFRNLAYGADDSIMKLWIDRGASCWRMDVSPWVPDDFWREWRVAVKHKNPDAMTIAEAWFDSSKFFLGDSFDSTMNYIFRNAMLDYIGGGKATAMYHNIEYIREMYPQQSFYSLMNLLSSHDVPRTLHLMGYKDNETDAMKIAEAKQRLLLGVFIQMTFPGSPSVYYGDEVGVTGGEDPFNRATYPWADKGGKPDLQMHAEFKKLIKLRKDYPVLRNGNFAAPIFIDDNVIVLARNNGDQWAITAMNNSTTPKTITLKLPENIQQKKFTDAITSAQVDAINNSIQLTIPALFGTLLISM
jgi:cyclomaltodextrinase / maltogenic alpha-amylase / neopullulanase